jgi:hypothetical protein
LKGIPLFVKAIETVGQYTRPIHSISRYWGSETIHPGAATLFFVNEEGWALTCRHVAEQFIVADQLRERWTSYQDQRATLREGHGQQPASNLEPEYEFSSNRPVEMLNRVIDCVEGEPQLKLQIHPTLDLALLKFSDYRSLGPKSFPVFAKNGGDLKQGRSLCRLGFPFPEFSNFAYDASKDSIHWTSEGRGHTPRFPIEGMVTRHLAAPDGSVFGFEMSTPGLRGQSGGPAFDPEGIVWGMQTATAHLDLNFDVDMDVVRDGTSKRIHDHAILHVGRCIHVDALKEFMREHGVQFAER